MAIKLALRGKSVSGYQFYDDAKPFCDDPCKIARGTKAGGMNKAVEVAFHVPCRKCEKCLKFRRLQWRDRAMTEILRSPRTWFITLTFDPHHLAGIKIEATSPVTNLKKVEGKMEWFESTSYRTVERTAYAHVQKYLKRLRKSSGRKFKYLAVFELGSKTGRPHYHLLLHEQDGPVTKQMIEDQWRSFVSARLVAKDELRDVRRKASYITSYATKSFDIRPRASVAYGKDSPSGCGAEKEKDARLHSGNLTLKELS